MKKAILLCFTLVSLVSFGQVGKWTKLPSPLRANITKIAVNSNNGRIYAVTGSFIYYSSNGGSSWNLMNPNNYASVSQVKDIAINPLNGTVYIASDNGGIDWTTDPNGNSLWYRNTIVTNPVSGFGEAVYALAANPNTGTLFAGIYCANTNPSNLVRNNINGGATSCGAEDYHFTKNGDVYLIQQEAGYCGNPGASGIFKSSNDGVSWTKLALNLPDNFGFQRMASDSNGNIYVTTNAGVYRMNTSTTTLFSVESNLPALNNLAYQEIEIDRGRNIIYLLRNSTLFQSTNGGSTWQPVSSSTNASSLQADFALSSNGTIWAGGILGVYAHNGALGVNFENRTGNLATTDNQGLEMSVSNKLFIQDKVGLINYSATQGANWQAINYKDPATNNLGGEKLVSDSLNNIYTYTWTTTNTWVYRYEVSSGDWADISYNLTGVPKLLPVGKELYCAVGKNDENTAPAQLYRFSGNNWTLLYDASNSTNNIVSITELQRTPTGRLLALGMGNFGYTQFAIYSDDNGQSWNERNLNLVNSNSIKDLVVAKGKLVGLGSPVSGMTGSLAIADSNGLVWNQFVDIPSQALLKLFSDKSGSLVGTAIGSPSGPYTLFRSKDLFSTYDELNTVTNGYPQGSNFSKVVFDSKNNIYGITPIGLWKYTVDSTALDTTFITPTAIHEAVPMLPRVFPNPVKDLLYIDAGIETKAGVMGLCITNSIGQVVYKREEFCAYSTCVSLADLYMGVYLLQLQLSDGRIGNYRIVRE